MGDEQSWLVPTLTRDGHQEMGNTLAPGGHPQACHRKVLERTLFPEPRPLPCQVGGAQAEAGSTPKQDPTEVKVHSPG